MAAKVYTDKDANLKDLKGKTLAVLGSVAKDTRTRLTSRKAVQGNHRSLQGQQVAPRSQAKRLRGL